MSEILTELGILNVHVVNQPELPERTISRFTTRTVVLSSTSPYADLASGPDINRGEITIIAIDVPVVLCDSQSQAQAVDNTVSTLPNPRGALIPINVPVWIEKGQTELYVAAPLTGNAIARVSIITTHKVKM